MCGRRTGPSRQITGEENPECMYNERPRSNRTGLFGWVFCVCVYACASNLLLEFTQNTSKHNTTETQAVFMLLFGLGLRNFSLYFQHSLFSFSYSKRSLIYFCVCFYVINFIFLVLGLCKCWFIYAPNRRQITGNTVSGSVRMTEMSFS